MAGSEVMQCRLNEEAAEAASRACFLAHQACIARQLLKDKVSEGFSRPHVTVWLTGQRLDGSNQVADSTLSLLFPALNPPNALCCPVLCSS